MKDIDNLEEFGSSDTDKDFKLNDNAIPESPEETPSYIEDWDKWGSEISVKEIESQINKFLKKAKVKKIVAIILSLLALVLIALSVWFATHKELVIMNYNIPSVDMTAIKLEDNSNLPDIDVTEGGGYGMVTYMEDVNISISQKTSSLVFQNPSNSKLNMVVHLVVGDTEVGVSGLLKPGYGIDHFSTLNIEHLKSGDYEGLLQVDNYDPDTGERTIMATEMEVKVHVEP